MFYITNFFSVSNTNCVHVRNTGMEKFRKLADWRFECKGLIGVAPGVQVRLEKSRDDKLERI